MSTQTTAGGAGAAVLAPPDAAGSDSPAVTTPPQPQSGNTAGGGSDAPAGDVQQQAREVYRQSVAAGAPLPGRVLGERFGRSERWGRDRIAEVKPTLPGTRRAAATRRTTGSRTAPAAGNGGTVGGVVPAGTEPAAVANGNATTPAAGNPAAAGSGAGVAGGRLVAWVGFVFGSVMSVAANVLHTWLPAAAMPAGWSPGIGPQVGAAVWPIGLLLSVEVLSRVAWRPGWLWGLARYGGAGTVAIGSALISYGHLRDVLTAWHYGPVAAHVGPLVLDGLMVISGFALLAHSQRQTGATS